MNLFKAHHQWATRPADHRFNSLQEVYDATKAYAEQAHESLVNLTDLRVEAHKDDVVLLGNTSRRAKLTNWAFGQLCSRVEAPANYMRLLPATLACQNLNHGLKQRGKEIDLTAGEGQLQLLFHNHDGLLLRALTTDRYTRIWNYEVAERLITLQQLGWEPARPGFGGNINMDEPPALYASDHDMFVFILNRQAIIKEPGNPDGLMRGVIVVNSEVGAGALKLLRFLYRGMCGNHIIWGASKMVEIKVRHVGNAHERWDGYQAEIKQYLDESATEDEAVIKRAKTVKLGDTKEKVLDKLFGIRKLQPLSRRTLDAGYDAVNPEQDGDPTTVWGIVQGLTRYSQTIPYTDQRTTIDQAAGRIMGMKF